MGDRKVPIDPGFEETTTPLPAIAPRTLNQTFLVFFDVETERWMHLFEQIVDVSHQNMNVEW